MWYICWPLSAQHITWLSLMPRREHITAKTWHKNKSTNTRHTEQHSILQSGIKIFENYKHTRGKKSIMALCCFNRSHICISNRVNTTTMCVFSYFCIVVCDGPIPAGWSRDTVRARDNDKCNVWVHSFHCPRAPSLSGHLTVDIRYCQWGPDNCPTWTSSLDDTVQTLTIHITMLISQLYLSTYRRCNPTVHFYLFSCSYHN